MKKGKHRQGMEKCKYEESKEREGYTDIQVYREKEEKNRRPEICDVKKCLFPPLPLL